MAFSFGPKAIKLAARIADGYITMRPNPEFVRTYREAGGGDRPVQGGIKVCGPDPEQHLAGIRAYEQAGFDEVCISQVGPQQDGFFEFYAGQVLPRLRANG